MALMQLDGPDKKTHEARFIGFAGKPMDFDLGGISTREFINSGRNSISDAKHTKSNPTEKLQALISHLDTELANPNSKGFSTSKLMDAQKELTQWANHDVTTTAQRQEIKSLINNITTLAQQANAEGASVGFSINLKKLGQQISTAAKAVSHTVQQVAKVASTAVQAVVHTVAVVGAAPARLAALGVISANINDIATLMAQAWQTDSGKVSNFWTELGGNVNDLKSAIQKGSGKSISGRRMGADELATDIDAVAIPILKAIFSLLTAMGIPIPASLQTSVENSISNAILKAGTNPNVTIQKIAVPANAGVLPRRIPTPLVLGGLAAILFGSLYLMND